MLLIIERDEMKTYITVVEFYDEEVDRMVGKLEMLHESYSLTINNQFISPDELRDIANVLAKLNRKEGVL